MKFAMDFCEYFFNLSIKYSENMSLRKNIYERNIFQKEIETKLPNFRNITNFWICTKPEVKVSIPIKIDRNYQNNHIAANSLQFLSADQFLL